MLENSGCNKALGTKRQAGGFSIVELMVTVAVAAILLGLAIPSFRELSVRSNVTQTTNELVGVLNLARSEAVRRGTLVRVESISGSGGWSGGWKVTPDSSFNSFGTLADPIISQPAIHSGYSACAATNGTGTAGLGSDGFVVFDPTGAVSAQYSSGFDINVNRPDANTTMSQHISVKPSGEVQSKKDTAGSPAPTSC